MSHSRTNGIWLQCCLALLCISTSVVISSDEISSHIKKCCSGGKTLAKVQLSCENYEYEVLSIPPLWRGLCHSTFAVCCSREVERQHCIAGRLAALTGSRCNEQFNMTTYADCCRACQVGLAVKVSSNNCDDPLFNYFSGIESFRICCGEESHQELSARDILEPRSTEESVTVVSEHRESEGAVEDSLSTNDGTIVLAEDDDDICGKVPNLCHHICENTKEAYRCKCNPGYKLNDNQVTCSPINADEAHSVSDRPSGKAEDNTYNDEIDETEDEDEEGSFEEVTLASVRTCPKGFQLDPVHNACVDVDECIQKLHNCKSNQYCLNTKGGFHCLSINSNICDTDYKYNEETAKCERVTSKAESMAGLSGVNYTATTGRQRMPPSVAAIGKLTTKSQLGNCEEGFQFKNGRCVDVDECLLEDACDSNQVCVNDIGGYHCDCKIGFNLDTTTNACVDINECSINNHNCLPTQRCDNTVGSYVCTRLQSCGTGYTLNADSGTCDDDDECALNTHNCRPDYECYNTKGSFRCYRKPSTTTTTTTPPPTTTTTTPRPTTAQSSIPYYSSSRQYGGHFSPYVSRQTHSHHQYDYLPGYSGITHLPQCDIGFQRNHLGACVDINECVQNNPCGSHQRCINTNGSYRCQNLLQCSAGYKSNPEGTACVDINECETGEHNCAENQICRNRNGGFICTCPPGHQLTRLKNGESRCVDIDECEQERPPLCPSNAQCSNTLGSYYCECKSGFQKSRDNDRICLDVDECNEIPGLCQQKCVNYFGGYRCTCNAGYELGPDNRTCNDVDECEIQRSYKLCMGFCNNVPGSYECSCPRGYTLDSDRNTCRDIDECASGEFCTGRNDVCTNIRGSYKCTTIHCPYGYVNDPDHKTRCRLISNLCEGDDCYNKPSAYTYNFITLVSKLMVPPEGRVIFSLRGPIWYDDIEFDLKIVKIQAAANIEKASYNHFGTTKNRNEVHLSLKRFLEGPQEIELELSMTVFTSGLPRGKSVAKIFILVSQYTF